MARAITFAHDFLGACPDSPAPALDRCPGANTPPARPVVGKGGGPQSPLIVPAATHVSIPARHTKSSLPSSPRRTASTRSLNAKGPVGCPLRPTNHSISDRPPALTLGPPVALAQPAACTAVAAASRPIVRMRITNASASGLCCAALQLLFDRIQRLRLRSCRTSGHLRLSFEFSLLRRHISSTPRTGSFFCVAANSSFVPLTAVSKCSTVRSQTSELLDHLVGATKQRCWEGETKSLGGLEIDDELHFRHLLNR
jgi:hypothetical protein